MTVIAGWLTQRGDPAGGQTRAQTRMLPLGTMWPAGATTSRQGIVPGGDPMAVTGSGMTVTVALGRAIVQGSASAGAYPVAVTAPDAVVVTNGDPTNPRRDIVGIRVYDSLVDASGMYLARVEILQGAAAPSPVDPTPPAGAVWLPLARLRIPAGASAGSPPTWGSVIDDLRAYTVSAGGVLPDPSGTAVGAHVGQLRLTGDRVERWTGSAWAECALPSTISPSTWGAWTQVTPTWTATPTPAPAIGAGTMYLRWARVGRIIRCKFRWAAGSGTTMGGSGSQWAWSLPVAASTTPDGDAFAAGPALALRPALAFYAGTVQVTPSTGTFQIAEDASGFAWGNRAATPWPTVPASGDSITATFEYEAAS